MSAPADSKLERISGGAGAAIRHDSAAGHVTGTLLAV